MNLDLKRVKFMLDNPDKGRELSNELELKQLSLQFRIEKNIEKLDKAENSKILIKESQLLTDIALNELTQIFDKYQLNSDKFKIIQNLYSHYLCRKKFEMIRNSSRSKVTRIHRIF